MEREIRGRIFEIERFAINDGPGIRTIVFMKGCPLQCQWCANPESQKPYTQLMYWINRCIGCKRCISRCPNRALSWDGSKIVIDRSKCVKCGTCAQACNSNALTTVGEEKTVEEVMKIVSRDERFYKKSGGGVTFSGGEMLAQAEFVTQLAKACKEKGYHTCVESCGFAPWDKIAMLMNYIDVFLYDFKCMDSARHKHFTGVPNEGILNNYKNLLKHGKTVVTRVPVIPGVNNNMENFQALADFLLEYNPGCRMDLLPYHSLGVSKYDRLSMDYKLRDLATPSEEEMEGYRRFFLDKGFYVTIGG